MSVKRKVRVPVGGLATTLMSSLLPLRGHYSSGAFLGSSVRPSAWRRLRSPFREPDKASCAASSRPSADGLQYGCGKARLDCSAAPDVLPANRNITREPTSGLEPLTPAPATSWLVAIPGCTTPCRYGAYRSRTLSRGGVGLPTVYRRVPARLQYDCSKRARSCFTTDSPFPRAPSRRHHLRLPRPAGCRALLPARTGRRPPRKVHLLCPSSGIRL